MKASTVGRVAVSIMLIVICLGFGIAQAGGTNWYVEVLDSSSGYQQEGRPVTFFHLSFPDFKKPSQEAKSPSEDMQLENPIETGSLPSEKDADTSNFDTSGILYRGGVDTGP